MANIVPLLRYSEWTGQNLEPKFPALRLSGLKLLLSKGLLRGTLAEVSGPRSSGRTSMALHILAEATRRGEICAIVDLHDSFHPASAEAGGVDLTRIIWTRCRGNAEHAMRATDLLLHGGGFGVVMLDLFEASPRVLNRMPGSYWYRFRRALEHTPAILLICVETAQAKFCSLYSIELKSETFDWPGKTPFRLLRGIESTAMLRKAAHESSAYRSGKLLKGARIEAVA
ncbi:MAG: hypothetical protein JO340_05300 [Acidobacteriaceae bacterium]|nr:hypothetical protein [Acidobacteriaceae bacterium]